MKEKIKLLLSSIKEFFTAKFGLGDFAYWVFRPFAYLIDFIWGTDLKQCDKCHERRVLWNTFRFFIRPRWAWIVFVAVLLTVLYFI